MQLHLSNSIKVCVKILDTNFLNHCCFSTMYRIFIIETLFYSSDQVELDCRSFALNSNSQGTKI